MLTKEKIISAIQAMPNDKFEDIEPVLDILIELAVEDEETENKMQEPTTAYEVLNKTIRRDTNLSGFTTKTDAEILMHINKKLNEATDPETIFLIKKIKQGIEDGQAGLGVTVDEMEKQIQEWFK